MTKATSTLGRRLAILRGEAGLSHDELAARAGLGSGARSGPTIGGWERDEREPGVKRLLRVCEALGTVLGRSPRDLLVQVVCG
jgi:transcriptional regulator with XRE-family HTH domain